MENQKIELLKDEKVRVQYVDKADDIKNKKQNVVGVRDITYDATYKNKAVAVSIFKEKASEYKSNLKTIKDMIKKDEEEIEKINSNIEINKLTYTKIESMIVKVNDTVKEIKALK